ncbi:MAG: mechanosensitive ion channel [Magnetospirillum sp.]|nr:mechanosensitive ion channel [Magnetospirillum sp.]
MMRPDSSVPQYRPFRGVLAALVLAMLAVAPAMAQTTAAPPATVRTTAPQAPNTQDLQHLLATLKNDKARAVLIGQIEALTVVQRANQTAADETPLASLSDAIGDFGDQAMAAIASLGGVPQLADDVLTRLSDPDIRSLWGRVLLQLVAVFAAGVAAERAGVFALARLRMAVKAKAEAAVLARIPFALARGMIDLATLVAFVATAYGTSRLFHHGGHVRTTALLIITAYGAARLALLAAGMLFSPRDARVRLVPIDDETAEYLMIWVRRIASAGLFGWFAVEAARLLGLPPLGHLLLLKALGLAVAAMAMIFVLQNRQPVAAALRRTAKRFGPRMEAVIGHAADIWHILTASYIAGVYMVWAVPVQGGAEFILRATVLTVVILAVARAVVTVLQRSVDRGFAISHEAKERFPSLEARANRYLPALHTLLRGGVGTVTVLGLLQAWGIGSLTWLNSDAGRRLLASAISIVAVLLGALIVWELVSGAIERYLSSTDSNGCRIQRSARARTLLPLARNALMIVIVVMAALIVLSQLGINIAPLLAGAGIVGIAVGFGSQKLVQDVITGAFILFEDTIAVGDVVKLDSHSGTVEAISIRAIRLRDGNGAIHTIPFSAVGTVVNMSREFAYAVFEVGVAYSEDTDRVTETLTAVGAELCSDPAFAPLVADRLEVQGVERFDGSAVVVKARLKTQPMKQWAVTREFNRRMKMAFDVAGIKMAAS